MTPKQQRLKNLHKSRTIVKTIGDMWDYVLVFIVGAGIIKLVLFLLEALQ
jgi:hypothetical protein